MECHKQTATQIRTTSAVDRTSLQSTRKPLQSAGTLTPAQSDLSFVSASIEAKSQVVATRFPRNVFRRLETYSGLPGSRMLSFRWPPVLGAESSCRRDWVQWAAPASPLNKRAHPALHPHVRVLFPRGQEGQYQILPTASNIQPGNQTPETGSWTRKQEPRLPQPGCLPSIKISKHVAQGHKKPGRKIMLSRRITEETQEQIDLERSMRSSSRFIPIGEEWMPEGQDTTQLSQFHTQDAGNDYSLNYNNVTQSLLTTQHKLSRCIERMLLPTLNAKSDTCHMQKYKTKADGICTRQTQTKSFHSIPPNLASNRQAVKVRVPRGLTRLQRNQAQEQSSGMSTSSQGLNNTLQGKLADQTVVRNKYAAALMTQHHTSQKVRLALKDDNWEKTLLQLAKITHEVKQYCLESDSFNVGAIRSIPHGKYNGAVIPYTFRTTEEDNQGYVTFGKEQFTSALASI